MAQSVIEKACIQAGGSGSGNLIKVYGTGAPAAGAAAIVIKPGNQDTNVAGSSGLRKILGFSAVNVTSAGGAFKAVKTYDSTQDGDIITVTMETNDDNINYIVEGIDNGS